jgi:hypothetical protein
MTTLETCGPDAPVFVNGRVIRTWTVLKDGDRITLGLKELSVFQSDARSARPTKRPPGPSLPAPQPRRSGVRTRAVTEPDSGLGRAADKLLALGRIVQAEDLLSPALRLVLSQAKEGRDVPPQLLDWVVAYAFKLARDTRRGSWLDFVLELHLTLETKMTDRAAVQFHRISATAREFDRQLLSTYERVIATGT